MMTNNFGECPYDGSGLCCVDTRIREDYRYRRYKCPECNYRITTTEVPARVERRGRKKSTADYIVA